jgi:hypothetical protein
VLQQIRTLVHDIEYCCLESKPLLLTAISQHPGGESEQQSASLALRDVPLGEKSLVRSLGSLQVPTTH